MHNNQILTPSSCLRWKNQIIIDVFIFTNLNLKVKAFPEVDSRFSMRIGLTARIKQHRHKVLGF